LGKKHEIFVQTAKNLNNQKTYHCIKNLEAIEKKNLDGSVVGRWLLVIVLKPLVRKIA